MTRRDDLLSLRQMLDHAREALALVGQRSQAEVEQDRITSLALTRLLEIVGEAAGRVAPERRIQHPEIPWPQIVALRNRLIHGYDAVDFDIVWQILTLHLPPLVANLEAILQPPEPEPKEDEQP
jgi:uncharacterized protein with HEPN domain